MSKRSADSATNTSSSTVTPPESVGERLGEDGISSAHDFLEQQLRKEKRREEQFKEVDRMRAFLDSRKKARIINPQGKFMEKWDVITMLALIFTALFAPFEVAFLTFKPSMFFKLGFLLQNLLFFTNRLADIVFIWDIGVNFFLSFQDRPENGGGWVRDPKRIVHHYLKSWFLIDVVSVLPFDLVGVVLDSDEIRNMKSIRLVRLMRLLKLVRILKASRMFTRWESKIGVSFGILTLWKFGFMFIFVTHWLACIWGMAPTFSDDPYEDTWMGIWEERRGGPQPYIAKYWICMYVALLTIGSGVGDIAPNNNVEVMIYCLMLALGSSMWAYIIGSICGVISTLDPYTTQFKQVMDHLNYFMRDKLFPTPLRQELRAYFNQTKHLLKTQSYGSLMDGMSMELKGKVAYELADQDLENVWFLKTGCNSSFLMAISMSMENELFAQRENIACGENMRIVVRGLAARGGRIISIGGVWGEDCLVTNPNLRDIRSVVAFTYLEVQGIKREHMLSIAEFYPKEKEILRKAAVLMALRRAFKLVSQRMLKGDENSSLGLDIVDVLTRVSTVAAASNMSRMITLQEAIDSKKEGDSGTVKRGVVTMEKRQLAMEKSNYDLAKKVDKIEHHMELSNLKLDALLALQKPPELKSPNERSLQSRNGSKSPRNGTPVQNGH